MPVFHLKASFGSRAGGQSARAKSDYIEREGRYEKDGEELEHKEHGNMPEWAEDDPGKYWEAADEHERANGRLYSEVQFALPKELGEAERRELAGEFAERVCSQERLPYTLAIHRGGANGENPHAHLMFSERGHDGIERSAEQWFKRYNAKAPEKGGARKSREAKAGDWLEKTRKAWEQTANRALERAADFSREPNVHLGPERYRTIRGGASEAVKQAGRVERRNAAGEHEREADRRKVERLEREIAGVEGRLKETYDRVRTAIDERIRQARRAVRRGSEAVGRTGRSFNIKHAAVGRACNDIDRRIRGSFEECKRNDQRPQRCCKGYERTHSLIHGEAEQKRNAGDRRDRVEGRIESLIQGRVRSRGWDFSR